MMGLRDYSTDDLLEELKRREELLKDKPKQLPNPDWTKLITICEECIDDLMKCGEIRRNFMSKALDTALEAVYGADISAWIEKAIG